ncbi:unnamed protein product, partial [Arabidopsis halleri]
SGHSYENVSKFKFSTKRGLETSWRDECVSDDGVDIDGDSYMRDDFESTRLRSFAETSHQDEPKLYPAIYVPVQNQGLSPKCKDPKAKEIALSYRKKISTSRSSALGQPFTIKKGKISKSKRSTMAKIYSYISEYFGVLLVIALESVLKHIEHISRIKSNIYIFRST